MGLGLLREPPVGLELCLQGQGPPSLSTTAPGNVTAEQGVGLEGGGHQAGVGEGSCQPHLGPGGASGGRCHPAVAPGPAVEKGSSGGCRAPPSPECGIGGVPWGALSVKGIFPSQSCPQPCLQEERPCCARGFGVGAAPAAPGASLREQGITGSPWGGDSCNFGVLQWAGREGGCPLALWGTQEVADAVKATPLPSP